MKDTFKFKDIKDFDQHINLSIPNYKGLVEIFSSFVVEFTTPSGYCIDLGCSTGSFLAQVPKIDTAYYVGVDEVDMEKSSGDWKFIQKDIGAFIKESPVDIDVIVLMFTLQFLGNKKRKYVVDYLRDMADNGTTVLIAEKVYCDDSRINNVMHINHILQKQKNFSADQILDKDYKLMGSMFCKTMSEITEELDYIGLNNHQVWQSYNFNGWVIRK